jgi:uncharacterized protein with PIN domain
MTSPEMTADLAAAFKLLDGTQNLSDAVEVVAALQARVTALDRLTDELARQRNILQSRVTVLELVIRRLPRKGESVYRSELDRALREAHAVLDPKGAAHGAV